MTKNAFDKISAGLNEVLEMARSKSAQRATVWVYNNQLTDELLVFATADAADAWFAENDPEGVAFKYPVISESPSGSPPQRTPPPDAG